MPPGAGPTGPEGGAVDLASDDPIFDGPERVEPQSKKATLLFQFFLLPLLIVVASVGVFLFFGAIGGSQKSAKEFLADVRNGGENVQKQAAQQLATILHRERERVDAKEIPLEKAEFADPAFRRDLAAAFEEAFDGRSLDRQAFLASAMGLVGDPDFVVPLVKRSTPPTPPEVRRAVARALGLLETSATVPALVTLLKDDDEPVRNQAVEGLTHARARTPAAIEGLKGALRDDSEYVRVNAAAALALAGDASGVELVGKLLDPAFADEVAGRPIPGFAPDSTDAGAIAAMRQHVLAIGMKAALALHADALKPRIEALTKHADKSVRDVAQQVLDRWGPPK